MRCEKANQNGSEVSAQADSEYILMQPTKQIAFCNNSVFRCSLLFDSGLRPARTPAYRKAFSMLDTIEQRKSDATQT